MADLFSSSGMTEGYEWFIDVAIAHDTRYFALVEVGSTKTRTQKTYELESEAIAAGKRVVADTIAVLIDLREAA